METTRDAAGGDGAAGAALWDLAALSSAPSYDAAGPAEVGVQPILYPGEPFHGRPTRVFAYLGVPQAPAPPARALPGMVLVHGGGGTAFREWVAIWNARGYAAIAMDLGGSGAGRAPLPDGGPPQTDDYKFLDPASAWPDHWVYHSVANVLRAHSLLRHQPGVDPARIGLTGISWGGFLACIVAGIDRRLACAIPVYGCGFLQHDSAWVERGHFAAMSEPARRAWHERCDPSRYVGRATMPLLFVNGTNDFAYPLDSYRLTYQLVRSPRWLAVRVGLGHGHPQGWAPAEIYRFADHHLRGGPALPRLEDTEVTGTGEATARLASARPAKQAWLAVTGDGGRWPDRAWRLAPAYLAPDGQAVRAALPSGTRAAFLAVEDDLGGYASAPHCETTSRQGGGDS